MTREQIAELIRQEYDPKPATWKAGESGWDDGAERIADLIIADAARLEKERFKFETALMLIGHGYPDAASLANAAIAEG